MSESVLKKHKVLIAEDDESINRIYDIKFSREETIDLLKAADGVQALDAMEKHKPDLVLLDLMMPERDGFWVLEERNKKSDLKKIPIIVLSNLGQSEDKKRVMDLGAVDYMVKADVPIKQIISVVKEHLAKK